MFFPATLLVASLAVAAAAGSAPPGDKTPCVDSTTSTEINRLFRVGDVATGIALCPFAQITVDPHKEPITFTAPYQSLYTLGDPKDHSRATIVIENPDGRLTGELSTAIDASCTRCQGASIRSLHVDGGRDHLGGLEGADALIRLGGKGSNAQVLQGVEAYGARGYAVVHVEDGKGSCRNATIFNNNIHSSGNAPLDAFLTSDLARVRNGPPPANGRVRPGTWTDGISVACSSSMVSTNIVRDVSGAGIILRGAPGTQVHHNVIVAQDRDMLVGISAVANPVYGKDAEQQRPLFIRENRIHAAQAMIRIGLSTGSGAWSTDERKGSHQIPFGSSIVNNRLTSLNGYYGYAVALSDSIGLQVLDNAISASVWGSDTNACLSHPAFVPPTPLLRDPRSVTFAPSSGSGAFQPSFVDQHFGFLLCVGPGSGSSSLELARHSIGPEHGERGDAASLAGLLLQQMHPTQEPLHDLSSEFIGSRRSPVRKSIRRGTKIVERHVAPDGSEFAVAKNALRQVDRTMVQRMVQQQVGGAAAAAPRAPLAPRQLTPPVRGKTRLDDVVAEGLAPERPVHPPPVDPLPLVGMRKSRRGMAGAVLPPAGMHHHHPFEAAKRRGFR